ncbi:hypothetical protein GCM10007966_12840 [Legionella impletisoli]|uniref:Smr domain protein n=1 Tax=Legionella impletisoli TaxID=343510 RepID=A0A917JT57_9GAMM|nr:hypothetical protein [Legionella impletisoli]GGI85702.1 hypothetical protein GCM10007966_12840 [Legionella impletisoli]
MSKRKSTSSFKRMLTSKKTQTNASGEVNRNPEYSSQSRRSGGKKKPEGRATSYLADETRNMERARRILEQQGHRRHARVNARNHAEREHDYAPEGELQNNILQNPWLDSQRFDGVDPNLNPEPPLNTEARREFDNQRREQEMEKQLRLGHMPKMGSAPKPQGP